MPTPTVSDTFTAALASTQQKEGSLHSVSLAQVFNRADLFPTPTVAHLRNHDEPVADYLERRDKFTNGEYRGMPGVSLGVAVRLENTTTTNWGRFTEAINNWELVIGRQAPPPTEPDGPDNTHRLSAKFAEWLMGLPEGHVTDVGLTRNEQLKACGNGVVPQQAELALRLLLNRLDTN